MGEDQTASNHFELKLNGEQNRVLFVVEKFNDTKKTSLFHLKKISFLNLNAFIVSFKMNVAFDIFV